MKKTQFFQTLAIMQCCQMSGRPPGDSVPCPPGHSELDSESIIAFSHFLNHASGPLLSNPGHNAVSSNERQAALAYHYF